MTAGKIKAALPGLIGVFIATSCPAYAAGTPQGNVKSAEQACAALQAMAIAKNRIALPTNGAVVTSAVFVPGSASTQKGYCSVDGEIRPVNPQAGAIHFNVALPVEWNRKAMHLMGGGWDGIVVKGSSPVVGAEHLPTPVQRGYAAFGSDSGHKYSDPDWQANDEAFENFAGDQLRKTHDAAIEIMRRHYGSAPRLTYSSGGSGGGREALYVADRWPELYDGVIAFYPVWSAVGAFIGWIDNAQALAAPGAWSNEAQQAAVSRAVVSKCDGLDGAEDGLLSNVKACHFEPESLRCPASQVSSDNCLSQSQIAGLVQAYATARKLPYTLPNGVDSFFAYDVLDGGAQPRMGKTAPGGAITPDKSFAGPNETAFGAVLSDPFVRLVVMRNPKADLFTFRPDASPQVKERMLYLSRRMDVDPVMKRFIAKGGKILLVHGNADQVHSANWSDEFHRRMVEAYGAEKTRSHLRYYRIAGYGHGIGLRHGASFDFQADLLGALENWVEHGIAPANLEATDDNAQRQRRTRPMCEYPSYPRYKGADDVNAASNFTCAID